MTIHQAPTIRTTCPYCGVGCGLLAAPDGRGGAIVSGDPEHPANFGLACSKGAALGETLGLGGRLLHPMLRQRDGTLARVDWSSALNRMADEFDRIIERDGPEAIAFYLSGQLLTEDYYVANKLMKGFLGSANVDTNSRLCMSSTVSGHRRAFGSDTVPGSYEDLDSADLIVLVGSNAAWCHPVLYQRIMASKRTRGAKLVVIDPRRTATADDADLVLQVRGGTDTALFCGLLVSLADSGALDPAYIDAHTNGFVQVLARAREIAADIPATAAATGLAEAEVARFFDLFRTTEKVVTAFSQGVNQSAQGTDKVTAIINCHLATGRIGKPGMGPFSLTGQPNAMGGREVGGLANQLAAHMYYAPEEIDRVRRFWNAPRMVTHEGLKAVAMFEAIAQGKIKALWVLATNPVVSLPDAGAVRAALSKLELFVVSDNVLNNDTITSGAHVLLPAAAWGEKDGTVTNSERRISRQRAFMPLPGEARPDWWIVTQVAQRLGFDAAFPYSSAADIFREHAALSAFENNGTRDFDIGALAALDDRAYDDLAPVQWPCPANGATQSRLFAQGGFFTPDRKACFVAPEPLADEVQSAFPFRLNTGRVRDQWHTMTRTGSSPRLATHRPEPFLEIHPADASRIGLVDAGFARVATAYGSCVLQVRINDGQQAGTLFAPIHWSDANSSSARVGELVAPRTDPYSGQPDAKATHAAIAPVEFRMRGFALTRQPIALPKDTWWARIAVQGGVGYRFATNLGPSAWRDHLAGVLPGELAEYVDEARGIFRTAAFIDGRLDGCVFLGASEHAAKAVPAWDVVKALFVADTIAERERQTLLSGRNGLPDTGPLVCCCFAVGLAEIESAVASGATSAEKIGKLLRAGTNCGSCLPELRKIVSRAHSVEHV
ncbi:MAG: molybdopterin-dependent oxidoreductase [Xanthobacteraceae bacterium]|nr:molybdopterin-dependent oxidoreductase [Xanthobacteraceae bacterium]